MPSILSEDDKETVKRQVPKATNKIHAVAVARLYVAYPNRNRWTYTGLQGAAVLANDLVGNTYWLKLVDVSVSRPAPALCHYFGQPDHKARKLTLNSPRIEVSYGTRKSTTRGLTTKTELSFTHSRPRIVWRDYPSWMKRKQRPF